jgi:hypothetical protein
MFQIQGSGTITATERAVSSFIKLHLCTQGTAEIISSNEEKVIVECDDNIHQHIQVTNSGRTLYVVEETGVRQLRPTKLHVKVFVRQIDTITNSMQGNAFTTGAITTDQPFTLIAQSYGNTAFEISAPSLKANLRCHGNVTLTGTCNEANIKTASHGDLDTKGLMAGSLTLRNLSHGNVQVYSSEKIALTHMGNGYIHYYGPGKLKDIKFMGNGEVKHMD